MKTGRTGFMKYKRDNENLWVTNVDAGGRVVESREKKHKDWMTEKMRLFVNSTRYFNAF